MREDQIKAILTDLNVDSVDIEASALISTDGLIISSALSPGMDEERISTMVGAMLSLGEQTTAELSCGNLEQVMISGAQGYVLIVHAGNDAVLCAIASKAIKLGLLFIDANRAAKAAAAILT